MTTPIDIAALPGPAQKILDPHGPAPLKQMAATPLGGEMPDLSRSLEALRMLRLAQDRTPLRPGVPAPGGAPGSTPPPAAAPASTPAPARQ